MATDISIISTFTEYSDTVIDLDQQSVDTLLVQFQDTTVLKAVLLALNSEVQVLSDAIVATMNARQPGYAVGNELDALGNILNQSRVLRDGTSLSNAQYESLLTATVTKNQVRFGSMVEFQEYAGKVFENILTSFTITGPFEVDLTVPTGTDTEIVDFLVGQYWSNKQVDHKFNTPIPATVRVNALDALCFTGDDTVRCGDIGIGEV